jgi:autotransporter-associated beta strand protein
VNTTSHFGHIIVGVLFASLAPQASSDLRWDGSQNNNWDNGTNWHSNNGQGGFPGRDGNGDLATFSGNEADRSDVDLRGETWTIKGIEFVIDHSRDFLFRDSSTGGKLRLRGDGLSNTGPRDHVFDIDIEQVIDSASWFLGRGASGDPGSITINGVFSGSGNFNVIASLFDTRGPAYLNLNNGGNTYSGRINAFSGGIIRLGHVDALQNAVVSIGSDAGFEIASTGANIVALEGESSTIDLGNFSLTLSNPTGQRYDGVLTGAGSLFKNGLGDYILGGANTFTGVTVVNAGTLILEHADAIKNSTAWPTSGTIALNVDNAVIGALKGSGSLDLGNFTARVGNKGSSTTFDGTISSTGGGLVKIGGGTLTLTGANGAETLTVNAGEVNINGGSLDLTFNGNNTLFVNNGSTANIRGGADVEITGATGLRRAVITEGGSNLIINGTGTTYTGPLMDIGPSGGGVPTATVRNNAAVTLTQLRIGDLGADDGSSGVLDILTGGSVVVAAVTEFHRRSTLNINGGSLLTDRMIEVVGTSHTIKLSDPSGGGSALTVGSAGGSSTFDGLIQNATSGAGSVHKSGDGSFTLGGDNTYSGGTTINGGTLLVENSAGSATGSGFVEIDSGALGGHGSVAGTVTVFGGAAVSPGTSVGVLTVGDVDFLSGSTCFVELAGAGGVSGTDFDQLVVANTATIGSGVMLDLSYLNSFEAGSGDSFVILDAAELIGEFDTINFPDSQNWFIEYDHTGGTVTVGLCPDADGDGVCDADDICPGFDDNIDTDGDGIPDGCDTCLPDFTGDGILDFFDVAAFLDAFSSGDPIADLTGDGIFDFFDVAAYLDAFSAGCP